MTKNIFIFSNFLAYLLKTRNLILDININKPGGLRIKAIFVLSRIDFIYR